MLAVLSPDMLSMMTRIPQLAAIFPKNETACLPILRPVKSGLRYRPNSAVRLYPFIILGDKTNSRDPIGVVHEISQIGVLSGSPVMKIRKSASIYVGRDEILDDSEDPLLPVSNNNAKARQKYVSGNHSRRKIRMQSRWKHRSQQITCYQQQSDAMQKGTTEPDK
jgi:hypothetical protein